LNFQLCWRTNAKPRRSGGDGEERTVVVSRDGRMMYPDVSDNNNSKSSEEGLMIRWAEGGEEARCCAGSPNQSVPVVNISLLSPEDGKGDIVR